MLKIRLKVVRAERELNQEELAKLAKVRKPTISDFENGKLKRLPLDALDRICSVLKCQPGDIIQHIEDQEGDGREGIQHS